MSDTSPSDPVQAAFDQHDGLRPEWLRVAVIWLPAALAVILLADWLSGLGYLVTDFLRFPAYVTAIIELLALRGLLSMAPRSLESVWRRGLIGQDNPAALADSLRRYDRALNHRAAWACGAVLALVALIATYPAQRVLSGNPMNMADWAANPFFVIGPIIQAPVAFVLGALAWRFGVTANFVVQIGSKFDLRILPNHPDRSGGLKPLGDLCLVNALVIVIAALPLAGWMILKESPDYEVYRLWSDTFARGIIVVCLGGALTFFLPVISIHQQMDRFKQKLLSQLDQLSHKMAEATLSLVEEADSLSPEESKNRLEAVKVMETLIKERGQIPTWPFDWQVAAQFAAAEAVPLLSLTGIGGGLLDVLGPALKIIAK